MVEIISIVVNDRDAFNIQMDNNLNIIYIHPCCTENKYRLGDRLTQVDRTKVTSLLDLPDYVICRTHFKSAKLTFTRDNTHSVQTKISARTPIRKQRNDEDQSQVSVLEPHLTSIVLNFELHINRNHKLGLFLKDKSSTVYVYRTADCCLGSLFFFAGDKLLEINETKVTSTEQAKKIFLKAFECSKPIKISLERPEGLAPLISAASVLGVQEEKKHS